MTTRRYMLATEPFTAGDGRSRREIREVTDDGQRPQVIAVVADQDAFDVREALARAYINGREDAGKDTP